MICKVCPFVHALFVVCVRAEPMVRSCSCGPFLSSRNLHEGTSVVRRLERIVIAGTSGAGKSSLARRLSSLLDVPYVELDSLYHGPDWTPREEFLDDVRRFVAGERWVIEWQYGVARPILTARATTLVWLDLPKWLVMWRVTKRSLRRRVLREEIWNGNRELPLRTLFTDPEHIIRWSWNTHRQTGPRVTAAQLEHPQLEVVRLRSPREVEEWLTTLT
jgi:adenylate kinase family enzyme